MKRGRNQRRRQGVNINRAFDSNGPDVRIRGTANQIYDKYLALARDASSSGDRVKAENYLQHAEHYFRVIRSMQAAQQQPQPEASEGESEQPAVGASQERGKSRDARTGDSAEAAAADDSGEGKAAQSRVGNGQAETNDADAADGQRRPRRRRPRRSARADGDEAGEAASKEANEAAAG